MIIFILDADVEDNLESDTSRCYNRNISDSILDEHSLSENISKSVEEISTEDGKKAYEEIQVTSFTFETSINNQRGCAASPESPYESPILNGPIRNSDESEELTVTYTITNGCITETEAKTPTVDQSQEAELVDEKKTVDIVESIDSSLGDSVKLEDIVNGPLANGIDSVHIGDKSVILKDSLTDVTSGVSTLSIGEKSATSCMSLSSDINKPIMNGETRENGLVNETAELEDSVEEVLKDPDTEIKKDLAEQDMKPNVDVNGYSLVQYRGSNTSKPSKSWKELIIEGKKKSINTLAERYVYKDFQCSMIFHLLFTRRQKFGHVPVETICRQ